MQKLGQQFGSLERCARRSDWDLIAHHACRHDDLENAKAELATIAQAPQMTMMVGPLPF
jgi:hypothetical protein